MRQFSRNNHGFFLTFSATLLALLSVLFAACGQQENKKNVSEFFGYLESVGFVDKNYILFKDQPNPERISLYIKKELGDKPEDPKLSRDNLALLLVDISRCLGLDAFVLTGVAEQESRFSRAIDIGNGTGLMQLTPPAIEEVNDQFGKNGTDRAQKDAIHYFATSLYECVAPKFDRFPWRHLWEYAPSGMTAARKWTIQDPLFNVLYGAVLLKVLLSVAKTGSPNSDLTNPDQVKLLYQKALRNYNGNPEYMEAYPGSVLHFAEKAQAN